MMKLGNLELCKRTFFIRKSITHGLTHDIQPALDRMRIAEEEVDNLRRRVTREVAEIGSLMVYRDDALRTAHYGRYCRLHKWCGF